MEELSLPRVGADQTDDRARARGLLLAALTILDGSALPIAATAAIHVSHAVELLSPGADRFGLGQRGPADPAA